MRLDQLFQPIDLDAVAIDGGADQIGPVQTETLDGGQEGGAFHDHLAARVDQGLAQQIQRLLAAGGDDQVGRGHALGAFADHELGQLLAQRVVALSGAVLQGRAGLLAQRLVHGLGQAGHVEQRGVWKAAGKADDARLAQQLEQLADGGGFDVVEAFCERK